MYAATFTGTFFISVKLFSPPKFSRPSFKFVRRLSGYFFCENFYLPLEKYLIELQKILVMFMVIYKITNLLNEKIYIGQTKQPIEQRFLQHSKSNSPLGQAMRECGLENFTIELVERCKSQNELNERE